MKNRIKARREELGVSQLWLAEKTGLPRSTVSDIENERHEPILRAAMLIARELGRSIEELFFID